MIGWLLGTTALAGGLEVGVLGTTASGDGTTLVPVWAGAATSIGAPVGERFVVELDARGGASTVGSPVVAVAPRLRTLLGPSDVSVLSVLLGAGLQIEEQPLLALSGGAGFDLGAAAVRPRLEATYAWTPGGAPWRLQLSAGVVVRRQPRAVPLPEEVAVVPEPAPVSPRITLTDAMVWVPGPVCAWQEPATASESFSAHAMVPAEVFAVDHRTFGDPAADAFTPRADPPPVQGSLVLAAWPGDLVVVNGEAVNADEDGVVVVDHPEGDVDVRVEGGGRVAEVALAVADGHALWIPFAAPSDVRVRFSMGSAALGAEGQAAVDALVSAAGGWSFTVHGSFSPEGQRDANLVLADARAAAVRAALIAAGLDEASITVVDPAPPRAGLPAPEQRAAVVRPIPDGRP